MYIYEEQKPHLLTDEGQRMFLRIRDHTHALLLKSGAVMMGNCMTGGGDSWQILACVDRMVELGEIREVPNTYNNSVQYRLFVARFK